MTLTTNNTLGAIAAKSPQAARVFEKHEIDFCCGGDRPFKEVCRAKSISADELLAEIETTAPITEERDWQSASMAELADHIMALHHVFLREEMPEIARMIEKVLAAHGSNHSESLLSLQKTFSGLQTELTVHMMKEETVLFPLVKRMEGAAREGMLPPAPGGSVSNAITVMEDEHVSAAAALREMRRLTSGYNVPRDGCKTYRALFQRLRNLEADLHVHIHLENNILFPRAIEMERGR
jgi:regulator of cell morphogenesis and NO signaling